MAVVSVVLAALLVFVGVLLGMDPGVSRAMREAGENVGMGCAGPETEVDLDLQEEILRRLESTYYQEIDPAVLTEGAIDGMLAGLGDPYTVYIDPEEYEAFLESTSGSYSGVGMALQLDQRLVTVVTVFEDSPSASTDIEPGDIIVAVDGVSTDGRTLDEIISNIKGPEGTEVTLEMYRPVAPVTTSTTSTSVVGEDGQDESPTEAYEDLTVDLGKLPEGGTSKEYEITRRSIVIPTTSTEILEAGSKKVAYIILYTFGTSNAGEQLRADVEAAVEDQGVDAVILDLRGNPGGLLPEAIEVAGLFIENGLIVSTEGLHSGNEELYAVGDAIEDIPVYVLTDRYSASASEIVAGALQDYGRAVIVGEATYGKGLVQSIEPLSNGGAVKVTTSIYLTPKGRDINATGVAPDVVALDDPATEDVDETVEKALDLIAAASASR